jgi:hypothetical protein
MIMDIITVSSVSGHESMIIEEKVMTMVMSD